MEAFALIASTLSAALFVLGTCGLLLWEGR